LRITKRNCVKLVPERKEGNGFRGFLGGVFDVAFVVTGANKPGEEKKEKYPARPIHGQHHFFTSMFLNTFLIAGFPEHFPQTRKENAGVEQQPENSQ